MYGKKHWKHGLALFLGLTAVMPAVAAEPESAAKSPAMPVGSQWYQRWLGRQQEDKKQPAQPKKEPPAQPLIQTDRLGYEQPRAHADYFRRMDVTIKLMRIAVEARDEEMQGQVEQMEKRIWDTCLRKMEREEGRP